MIFHFLFRDTKHYKEEATYTIPVGQAICGLQLRGSRPNSVTLTYDELAVILKDPHYAVCAVLAALAPNRSQGE